MSGSRQIVPDIPNFRIRSRITSSGYLSDPSVPIFTHPSTCLPIYLPISSLFFFSPSFSLLSRFPTRAVIRAACKDDDLRFLSPVLLALVEDEAGAFSLFLREKVLGRFQVASPRRRDGIVAAFAARAREKQIANVATTRSSSTACRTALPSPVSREHWAFLWSPSRDKAGVHTLSTFPSNVRERTRDAANIFCIVANLTKDEPGGSRAASIFADVPGYSW